MQVLPPRGNVSAFAVEFVKGGKYRTDEVVARLVAAGYSRSGHVDEPGRFAVRGDILDVCAPGGEAARIEFFGYDCESVRALDIAAQTAGKPLDAFTAYPATELVFGDDEMRAAADRLNAAGGKRACSGIPVEHRLAERLASGDSDGEQTVASLFPHSTLSEFCDLPVVVEDAKAVYDNCVFAYREHAARAKRLGEANESPFCAADNLVSSPPTERAVLCFHSIDSANRFFSPDSVFKFKSIDLPLFGKNFKSLCDQIAVWRSRGIAVYVGADIKRSLDELDCFGVEYIAPTADGGAFFDENAVVIGMRNVGMKRDPFESIRRTGIKELPKPGDYVVHETHGIGICEAVGAVDFGGYERDYITVRYEGGDTLYVPVENMGRLSKYDFTDTPPKLNKLGGAEFIGCEREAAKHGAAAAVAEAERKAADEAAREAAENAEAIKLKLGGDVGATETLLKSVTDELQGLEKKQADDAAEKAELVAAVERARAAVDAVRSTLEAAQADCPVDMPEFDGEAYDNKKAIFDELSAKRAGYERETAVREEALRSLTERSERLKSLGDERAMHVKRRDDLHVIAEITRGKAMLNYVAAEYIEQFTAIASGILSELSGGKYSMGYDKENGFTVSDFLNDGKSRKTDTLSGGELFLASLAVAIAIARSESNGNNAFFFLDEGFGTLDDELIDVVYGALESLSSDCLVGVISHSGSLIDRMPSCVEIKEATDTSGSRIVY